jgi:hypothetical protein
VRGVAGVSALAARSLRIALVAISVYLALAYWLLPALWTHHEHHPALAGLPKWSETADGIPGDPINVALIGKQAELIQAFLRAGWREPARLDLRSDIGIGASVLLDRPDPSAPVSNLFLFGRKQDLAFEREAGRSAKQRNHVRFWREDRSASGPRPLWLGAASFDRGVGVSHRTGQITHHIAPDIDAERDRVMQDLAAAGQLTLTYRVSGVGPTLAGRNGGGDRYFTDGEIDVGVLTLAGQIHAGPPEALASPPAVALKDWFWDQARPVLGSVLASSRRAD